MKIGGPSLVQYNYWLQRERSYCWPNSPESRWQGDTVQSEQRLAKKTRQKIILHGSVKRCNESPRRGTRSFEIVITVQTWKTADGSLRTKMLLSKQDSLNIQKRAKKFGVWKSYLRNKHIFPIGLFIVNASLKILITEVMLNCDSGSDWDSIQLGKFGCFKQGIEA